MAGDLTVSRVVLVWSRTPGEFCLGSLWALGKGQGRSPALREKKGHKTWPRVFLKGRGFGFVVMRKEEKERARTSDRPTDFLTKKTPALPSFAHTTFFYVKNAQIFPRQPRMFNAILFAFPASFPGHSRTEKVPNVLCLSRGLRRAPVPDEAPR